MAACVCESRILLEACGQTALVLQTTSQRGCLVHSALEGGFWRGSRLLSPSRGRLVSAQRGLEANSELSTSLATCSV